MSPYILPGLPKASKMSIERVIEKACKVFDTNNIEIFTRTRKAAPKTARQVVMWFCIKNLNYTTTKAGNLFGLKHDTAIHARNTVDNFIEVDNEFKSKIKYFKHLLR